VDGRGRLPRLTVRLNCSSAEEFIATAIAEFSREFFVASNQSIPAGSAARVEIPFEGGAVGVCGTAEVTPAEKAGRAGYMARFFELDPSSIQIPLHRDIELPPTPAPPPAPMPEPEPLDFGDSGDDDFDFALPAAFEEPAPSSTASGSAPRRAATVPRGQGRSRNSRFTDQPTVNAPVPAALLARLAEEPAPPPPLDDDIDSYELDDEELESFEETTRPSDIPAEVARKIAPAPPPRTTPAVIRRSQLRRAVDPEVDDD
jgi:hypothetical protein